MNLTVCNRQISVSLYIHVTVHRNRFLFNNQPDALIAPNLFCYKTLHDSDIFSAHHQEFSTVHSALVVPSTVRMELTPLKSGHQKPA
jgi:hypothetical protein